MVTSVISAGDAANLGVQTTGGNDGVLVLRSGAAGAKVDAVSIAASGTATFVGEVAGVSAINSGQIGGRRNIVYNGEMKVAQRSASETGLGAATGYFTLDRWRMAEGDASAGRYTMAQVADGPAGFANCLKLTTTTADTSIAAGEFLRLDQQFEGQDLQQLQKGTATAKQVTVSFYVKGNASATYTCELNDSDNSRSIAQAFAVTTSWNRIELTFAADTSDPLDDDNAKSLSLIFWLHGGSTYTGGTFVSNTWADTVANKRLSDSQTSIFDSTSRTLFITGVQMEIGATATEFESRTFGDELALCQRYYEKSYNATTAPGTSTNTGKLNYIIGTAANITWRLGVTFRTSKRASPTFTVRSSTGAAGNIRLNNASDLSVTTESPGDNAASFYFTRSAAGGDFFWFHYEADAEL